MNRQVPVLVWLFQLLRWRNISVMLKGKICFYSWITFSDLLKLAAKYRSVKEFTDYCRRATAAGKKHSGVAVGTCHSVKGLEFDSVYFVGVSEGILPHAKSTDLEEEKSIYFVGCSRAAKKLVISYSGIPSVFLKKEKNETNQSSNQGV